MSGPFDRSRAEFCDAVPVDEAVVCRLEAELDCTVDPLTAYAALAAGGRDVDVDGDDVDDEPAEEGTGRDDSYSFLLESAEKTAASDPGSAFRPSGTAGDRHARFSFVGYDPDAGKVLGMKVLESKETPGLGAKITSDSAFIHGFDGVEAPIEGVKHPARDAHQVDMITGATISSTTVISIINDRLEAVGPVLSKAGTRTATAAGSPGADAPRTAAAAGPGPRAAGPGQGGGER